MKIKGSLISCMLMALSIPVFAADKIVITGQPVTLEQQGEIYVVPKDYSATTSYHYVLMDGIKKVCYLEKQTNLTSLNATPVRVNMNGQQVDWNCYPIDETYFEVTP